MPSKPQTRSGAQAGGHHRQARRFVIGKCLLTRADANHYRANPLPLALFA